MTYTAMTIRPVGYIVPASEWGLIVTNFADHESRLVSQAEFGFTFVIGDGVNDIPTSPAVKGGVEIPVAAQVTAWSLAAPLDAGGSIVIDVWKDSYANFPPTNADSIAGTEKPTLSAAQKNQDLDLSTWSTGFAAGDWLLFEVESASSIKLALLSLRMVKS